MANNKIAEKQMFFEDAVIQCFQNKQFVKEYDRVAKTNILARKTPIKNMIDEQTGLRDIELLGFIDFVFNFVLIPMCEKQDEVK